MMKIRKDSNLSVLGRFGIAPFLGGGSVTALAIYWAKAGLVTVNGNFWLGLTMSATIMLIGPGIFLYSWWLDREENRRNNPGLTAGTNEENR